MVAAAATMRGSSPSGRMMRWGLARARMSLQLFDQGHCMPVITGLLARAFSVEWKVTPAQTGACTIRYPVYYRAAQMD